MLSNGSTFTKADKALLVVGAIGICICIYLLFFDRGSVDERRNADTVGIVKYKLKDTRQKSEDSFEWGSLRDKQNIFVGDSIYSGERSQVEVGLKNGGSVQVGENSLVTFETVEQEKVIDLELGNFKVKVNGRIKIAVKGRLTEIDGKNSEVQIVVKKNKKPQLRLLSGEANVIRKEKTIELKVQEVAALPVLESDTHLPAPTVEIPTSAESPHEIAEVKEDTVDPKKELLMPPTVYYWKLYDLYDIRGSKLTAKTSVPDTVRVDDEEVTPKFSDFAAPKFAIPENTFAVQLAENEKFEVFPLIAPPESLGFVIERSKDNDFSPGKTFLSWSKTPQIKLRFTIPGTHYYRFRSVGPEQELSTWSSTVQFNVLAPKPVLAEKPKTEPVKDLEKFLKPTKPGLSKKSPTPKKLKKDREIAAVPPVNEAKIQSPSETSSIRLPELPSAGLRNEKYKSTQISAQGFIWTMQSSEQRYAKKSAPVASGVGAHGLHWFNNHGLEWNIKSGVVALNETGNEASSLKYLESRYHYRFHTRAPFNLARELQWSLFGGAEIYRNSGTIISNQYDLFKYGGSLQFPLSNAWSTGGELVLGSGPDGSKQQQISGNINYFMNPDWSFGFGYRLHMFEAGSKAATPTGFLPYREGYTEGTSFLNYHF